jgi:multicomponent Na+:H+ antiporter subunit G
VIDVDLLTAVVADALVVLGVGVMTLGIFGIFKMPDVYTQLHAASKAVFLGVISLAIATAATRDPAIISRALLIGVLLLLTTPVASHVIARAAFRLDEPMRAPGARDESDRRLDSGETHNNPV